MSTTAAKRMKQRSKRCWTGEEDEQLVHLVTVHGTGNWSVIAEQLGNRTGKQCRERWHNHLNPEVKKGEWSQDEDRIILQMQAKLGNQWAKITKMLPGRTDNAVKNRWHAAMRAQSRLMKSSKDMPHDKSAAYSSDTGASSPMSDSSMAMAETKMIGAPTIDLNKVAYPGNHARPSSVSDFLLDTEPHVKRYPMMEPLTRHSSAPQPMRQSPATTLQHPIPHRAHSSMFDHVALNPLMAAPHMSRSLPDQQCVSMTSPVDPLILGECTSPTPQFYSCPPPTIDRPLTPLDDPALVEWVALLDSTDAETGSDDSFSKRTRSSYNSSNLDLDEDELAVFDWMPTEEELRVQDPYASIVSPRSGKFDFPSTKRNCSRDNQDPTGRATIAEMLANDPDFLLDSFSSVVPAL